MLIKIDSKLFHQGKYFKMRRPFDFIALIAFVHIDFYQGNFNYSNIPIICSFESLEKREIYHSCVPNQGFIIPNKKSYIVLFPMCTGPH